ncbi:MAG: type II toxin-antitoxin system prevent-host-death family antitoxin [Xanthobacteraceae bacterium]
MRSVGLKILKNKLSEYIRLAAEGETVLVTDRGRVVAELKPPQPHRPTPMSHEEFVAKGVREGWLTPASNRGGGPPPPAPGPRMTLEEILKDLDEGRADRDLP